MPETIQVSGDPVAVLLVAAPRPATRRAVTLPTVALLILVIVVALSAGGCAFGGPGASTTGTTAAIGSTLRPTAATAAPPHRTTSSPTTTTLPTTTTQATTTTSLTRDQVVSHLRRSVVGVRVVLSRTRLTVSQAVGTGVVFSRQGLVVTNNHVITGGGVTPGSDITVTLSSGREVPARLVGRDPGKDLAVLRIGVRRLVAATFRTDLSKLAHGDPVVAMGNPEFLDRPVTTGEVTAVLEGVQMNQLPELTRVIQATAPIMRGNSGGPLVDAQGRVIGINVGIPVEADGRGGRGEIAIPADAVVETVRAIVAREG